MDNEKKILIAIVACVGFVAVGGVGLFAIQFAHYGLSSSTSDWASFGSFVGGILGPLLSLLTIFYMVWSFKKQTALMHKQMKKDREKDERDMLLSEIRFHIEKIEYCSEQSFEFADVAESLILYLYGEKREYKLEGEKTLVVGGARLGGKVFPLLKTIESWRDVETVKGFINERRGHVFLYPLEQAKAALELVVYLMMEAQQKGASLNVIRSFSARCIHIAVTLNDWGELEDFYYKNLLVMHSVPVNIDYWPDLVTKMWVSTLNDQELKGWSHEDTEFEVKENRGEIEFQLIHKNTREVWVSVNAKEWKKAS